MIWTCPTQDWLPSPAGSLAFRRRATDGTWIVCVVACSAAEVPLPAYDEVLVSSEPLTAGLDGPARLPGDSAVWLRVH